MGCYAVNATFGTIRRMLRFIPLILAFVAVTAAAQAPAPKTVSAADAASHVVRSVQPIMPPLAQAVNLGGKVKLRLTISPSGDVSSVAVMSGHPLLVNSAMDAAKQWKYSPFLEGNSAVSVTTDIEMEFASGTSRDEEAAREKYFPVEDECRKLLNDGKYEDAEKKCRQAVEISNALSKGAVLERSDARSLLGNAIFLQRRFSEAIPVYQEALELDKGRRRDDDADLASSYANLGRAYAMTGQLSKADELYATAVKTFAEAIRSLPEMKENYSRRLQRTLNEYAQIKEAQGQTDAASSLRKQAEDMGAP